MSDQFFFLPRWCLSRTYVLSRGKKLFAALIPTIVRKINFVVILD